MKRRILKVGDKYVAQYNKFLFWHYYVYEDGETISVFDDFESAKKAIDREMLSRIDIRGTKYIRYKDEESVWGE